MTESLKKDDREENSPFEGVQKSVVLHEARVFSDPQINPRQCCRVLTKILYLIIQGEKFNSDEATGVFFGVTKLFQSKNANLRRMVYLVIKELSRDQDNVFVVINCLSKDMTGNIDLFRANAIRVYAKVIDASMLGTMERFLKQAIVDRTPAVAAAALITGQHLYKMAPDVIKRWQSEIQVALLSKSRMVQYHAVSLLYTIKKHDRLAIIKMVSSLCRRPPKSNLALVLMLRYIAVLLRTEQDSTLMDFIVSCLHQRNNYVRLEAARVLCALPNAPSEHVTASVVELQELLNSNLPSQRFAAVRTLSQIVTRYPQQVSPCSVDLELLIGDTNRSIATLAVTTLLKTGVESSVDRLMKSISSFIVEVSDELRIVLIEAIRALCLRYPHKHPILMLFLSNVLREEGGLQYKSAIVNTILTLMNEISDCKETGLDHLCEFIEDCEFPSLSVQILYVLGEEGPRASHPGKYIRFIFNRIILETSSVRAAAVQTLARFGAACPDLLDSIVVLLNRALMDNDDEVRDRATYCLEMLAHQTSDLKNPILGGLDASIKSLEYSLQLYLQDPGEEPFSLDDVVKTAPDLPEEGVHEDASQTEHDAAVADVALATAHMDLLRTIPEFAELGDLFTSSAPIQLTESEAEYVVRLIKHVFAEHVVLQFEITNYMNDQVLKNVTVNLETDDEWVEEMAVPAPVLEFEVGGVAFVCLKRSPDAFQSEMMPGVMEFSVNDAGAPDDEEGYADEYQLEEIEIVPFDFMRPHAPLEFASFRSMWEQVGTDSEVIRKMAQAGSNLQEVLNGLSRSLNMRIVEGSSEVPADAKTHAFNLCGEFLGGHTILARAGLICKQGNISLKIAVRSPSRALSEVIVNSIA